jgi:thymidylate kinase
MKRGKLIVFEGLDRAGKTTQCQMLVSALQAEGQSVLFMRFPGTCSAQHVQEEGVQESGLCG